MMVVRDTRLRPESRIFAFGQGRVEGNLSDATEGPLKMENRE